MRCNTGPFLYMRLGKVGCTGLLIGTLTITVAFGYTASRGLFGSAPRYPQIIDVELAGNWPWGPAFAVAGAQIGGNPYALLGSGACPAPAGHL